VVVVARLDEGSNARGHNANGVDLIVLAVHVLACLEELWAKHLSHYCQ